MATRPRWELYRRPKPQAFRRAEKQGLEQLLQKSERHTTIDPLVSTDELKLTTKATTVDRGYKYTYHAFIQMCQLLAPGLSTLLPDVSGAQRKGLDEAHIDSRMAIDIFNGLVELRFSRLAGYRVIRNEADLQIEGIIGAKHRFLENNQLFQHAEQVLGRHDDPVNFHAGLVVGRQMMLWYRREQPFLEQLVDDEPWRFYSGYYFCNGESSGVSVRGTLAIFSKQGTCLAPIDEFGGRVTHIGKDFSQRLNRLFGTILSNEVPVDAVREGFRNLAQTDLGYGGLDEEARTERSSEITARLGDLRLSRRLADDVVERTLFQGKNPQPATPTYDWERVFRQRKMLDLFAVLVRVSRGLGLNNRERMEQVAYSLLTNGL